MREKDILAVNTWESSYPTVIFDTNNIKYK